MRVKRLDTYVYTHDKPVTYSNSKGTLSLQRGTLFYFVYTDKPGDWISLDPRGPFFKLSDKSFNRLTVRVEPYKEDVTRHQVVPSNDKRSYRHAIEYQAVCLKNKGLIFNTLHKFMTQAVPKDALIKKINQLNSPKGIDAIGVACEYHGVQYRLTFYLGASPYFSYSIWVKRSMKKDLKTLPIWSKKLSTQITAIQQNLFSQLEFKVNPVKAQRSIVSLPTRNFDGTIYQWATRI